jgi:hypothetical protein
MTSPYVLWLFAGFLPSRHACRNTAGISTDNMTAVCCWNTHLDEAAGDKVVER